MLDFIEDFESLDQKFDHRVLMVPHFKFWACVGCNEKYTTRSCFGGGKYCGNDNRNFELRGREVIMEELRQICLYE
jgi:hypothetical protein